MIKQFENLLPSEAHILLKAPALISVYAACSLRGVNPAQKTDAVKLAHLKTFTAHPTLIPFYREVENNFKDEFEEAAKMYMPFDDEQMDRLKQKIERIKFIVRKLEPEYAKLLLRSFEKYERHVRRAAHSVVEDFIFPIPIPGLSD
jgi:hypothetical protein